MMRIIRSIASALVLVAAMLAAPAGAATVTSVFGGKVPCVQSGVQFCLGTQLTRVETWDGVPLDVNVTIPPAAMNGPFPVIFDLHGWGIGKSAQPYTDLANAGYVVVSYSARGFHFSCGLAPSRLPDLTLSNPNVCNQRGWIRLADARYEVRDTQHLAGLLADEGLVIPDRVGAMGGSYGGGQSMMLAALKDRVMLPDGTLVPWTSPGGLPMRIAAAAPLIPWSDLAYALAPNGRTLDYQPLNPYGIRGGVEKQSYVTFLHTVGLATGFYSAPGQDPDADIQGWKTRLDAGEPYDDDPVMLDILTEVTTHHSAYYIDDSVEPSPLFIYNAWTDDLFPATEALRFYRKTKAKYPNAEISLVFADAFGHPRASLGGDMAIGQDGARALFDRHLKGTGPALPPLETYTQGCGGSTEMGPFTAAHWDAIHPGEVRYAEAAPKSFTGAAGNALTAAQVDPLGVGVLTSCRSVSAVDDPVAATYRLPAVDGAGYTLMGSPTVIADITATGFAQIAARLWEVAPNNMQYLVSQGFYRPRTDNAGPQVFQLPANGWKFTAGSSPKLELLGQSAMFGRPSNGTFSVTVSNLELRLPVLETPGGVVQAPAPPVPPLAECAAIPVPGCKTPVSEGRSRLLVRDAPVDRLLWKLNRGAATSMNDLGLPTSRTGYGLCIYGSTTRLASLLAPAGGTCAGEPCWTPTSRGFRYDDRALTPSGIQRLDLRSGGTGSARILLKGRGANLERPGLPIVSLPVRAQLVNTDGICWETQVDSVRQNTAGKFLAKD